MELTNLKSEMQLFKSSKRNWKSRVNHVAKEKINITRIWTNFGWVIC